MADSGPARPQFSAAEFFATQPRPAHLEQHLEAVREFVERNVSAGRRVVLVTVSSSCLPNERERGRA